VPRVRWLARAGDIIDKDHALPQGCLEFEAMEALTFSEDERTIGELFTLKLGNTGRSGKGVVRLDWQGQLLAQKKTTKKFCG